MVSPALCRWGRSGYSRAWRLTGAKPNGSPALAICRSWFGGRASTGVRSRSSGRPWAPLQVALRRVWPATGQREQESAVSGERQAELIDLDGWLLALREAPELRAQQRDGDGRCCSWLA